MNDGRHGRRSRERVHRERHAGEREKREVDPRHQRVQQAVQLFALPLAALFPSVGGQRPRGDAHQQRLRRQRTGAEEQRCGKQQHRRGERAAVAHARLHKQRAQEQPAGGAEHGGHGELQHRRGDAPSRQRGEPGAVAAFHRLHQLHIDGEQEEHQDVLDDRDGHDQAAKRAARVQLAQHGDHAGRRTRHPKRGSQRGHAHQARARRALQEAYVGAQEHDGREHKRPGGGGHGGGEGQHRGAELPAPQLRHMQLAAGSDADHGQAQVVYGPQAPALRRRSGVALRGCGTRRGDRRTEWLHC